MSPSPLTPSQRDRLAAIQDSAAHRMIEDRENTQDLIRSRDAMRKRDRDERNLMALAYGGSLIAIALMLAVIWLVAK